MLKKITSYSKGLTITGNTVWVLRVRRVHLQYVVEGDVLGQTRVGDRELHVLGAVDADRVPEGEQGLLVGVHRHGGLRDRRVVQVPQVREVLTELSNIGL